MFVYLVVESLTWEGDSHIGVFTSLKKARKALNEHRDNMTYIPSDMHHYIEKWNTNTQESEDLDDV